MKFRFLLFLSVFYSLSAFTQPQLVERKPWILKLTTPKLELNINVWLKLEYDGKSVAKVTIDDISVPELTSYTYKGKSYYANSIPQLYPYFKKCGVSKLSVDAYLEGTSCTKIQLVMFSVATGDHNGSDCPRASGVLRISDAKIWDSSLFGVLELERAIDNYERDLVTNQEVGQFLADATTQYNAHAYQQAILTAQKGLDKNPKDLNTINKLQDIITKSKNQLQQPNQSNSQQNNQSSNQQPNQSNSQQNNQQNNANSGNSNSTFNTSNASDGQNYRNSGNSSYNSNSSWGAEQTQNYINQQQQNSEQTVQKISATVDAGVNKMLKTYYMQQQMNELGDNIDANRNLKGNYSSIAELEKDFEIKEEALRSAFSAYNNQVQQNYANLMQEYNITPTSGADGIEQGLEMAIVGISSIFAANKAEKEKKAALEELERQRQEMLEEIERKRIEMRNQIRSELIAEFPPGGMPMTKDRLKSNEVYFFFYSYDADFMTRAKPTFLVSNVFKVTKYKDDTWPLQSSINKEISALGTKEKVTLMGYYNDMQYAIQMRDAFYNLCKKGDIESENIEYAGKQNNSTITSNTQNSTDFWGQPIQNVDKKEELPKSTTPTTEENEVDFWGQPIKKN